MRLLIVTPKLCRRVGSACYSTGGTPKEFNALATVAEVTLLAQVLTTSHVPDGWERLDERINVSSLGSVRDVLALAPPLLAARRAARLVTRLVTDTMPDLVLLKGPSEVSFAPLPALRLLGVPTIYHLSLDWLGSVAPSARLNTLRRLCAPYFIAVRRYREHVFRRMLPQATAVATVCTPIARDLERFGAPVILLRETFTTSVSDIPGEPPSKDPGEHRFLCVGRIDRNKNVGLIVRALHVLALRGQRTIRVDVIGDGTERPGLEQLARSLGVADRIGFLGYVSNDGLQPHYRSSRALILPSFSEMFPQVIVEAMTQGTPVIATNVGGVCDLVQDGENGFLIDPFSPESLAAALSKMAYLPPENYQRMQREALARAREHTREATVNTWRDAFVGVAKERRGMTKNQDFRAPRALRMSEPR